MGASWRVDSLIVQVVELVLMLDLEEVLATRNLLRSLVFFGLLLGGHLGHGSLFGNSRVLGHRSSAISCRLSSIRIGLLAVTEVLVLRL